MELLRVNLKQNHEDDDQSTSKVFLSSHSESCDKKSNETDQGYILGRGPLLQITDTKVSRLGLYKKLAGI